jgi:hypothetical protein
MEDYMVRSSNIPVFLKLFMITPISIIMLNSDPDQSAQLDNRDMLTPLTPSNNSSFIDINRFKKPDIIFEKEAERKSLADFRDFLQNTRNVYFTIWLIRIAQVNMFGNRQKEEQIVINPLRWWKNLFAFQNDGRKRGDLKWKDGDRFKTNWIAHPAFGAFTYLYYRAKGYDRFSSAFGSALMSTLFEYTIEGFIQSPSNHDMAITSRIGVLAGIVLEETSDWLISANSGFLNALAYVVNPMRIVPDKDEVNLGPSVSGQVVIAFQW